MLPIVHLKDEVKPNLIPLTFINLSPDTLQIGKHNTMGYLQLNAYYQELQQYEIHQITVKQFDITLA